MQLEITEQDQSFAEGIYRMFKQKPGSQHIAGSFAISCLSAILRQNKPENILEFGAGIGTMTYAILDHEHQVKQVTVTEANDFCIEQLKKNLTKSHLQKLDLHSDDNSKHLISGDFDLVIFDGNVEAEDFRHLREGTVCMVEGFREKTRNAINQELQKSGLICNFKNYASDRKQYFAFGWKKTGLGFKRPKFKLVKHDKGCWIGQVEKL